MPKTTKKITTIPATLTRFTATPITEQKKRRVAGYARVSTDHDDQFTSYEAQIDYYTNYIKSRDDWEFVDVYTDAGITGTSTKHREGFKRMVADALAGKIDLIVTKSVSRFARNTVDSLTTILQLKENMGMTVVVVTHDLDSIFTIGNNSVFLDATTHTMITGGDPHVLRCDPAHPDIVRFLNRGKTESCSATSKGYRS